MIDRGRRKTNADLNIHLLLGRNLIGGAEMQQMTRPAALRKVTRILDKCVHWFSKLTIEEKSGLANNIAFSALSWPIHGQLPGGGPIIRELARPGQLHARVVPVARHGGCTGGDAQEDDQRYVKSRCRAELLFQADGEVSEARNGNTSGRDIAIIIRNRKTHFGSATYAKAQRSLRTVEAVLPLSAAEEDAVLHLETALRYDDTGVGNGWPIR